MDVRDPFHPWKSLVVRQAEGRKWIRVVTYDLIKRRLAHYLWTSRIKAMSFTNKPSVALTLDQVMEIVDQLSAADKLKVAKRMRGSERNEAIDDLIAIFSKVKMSEKEVSALVEDVRAERYASQKTRTARR